MYEGDKKKHKLMLLAGMWSKALTVVKRSVIESHTVHRYIPVKWTRQVSGNMLNERGEGKWRARGEERERREKESEDRPSILFRTSRSLSSKLQWTGVIL